MKKYAIIYCYGTTDIYYVEPSDEQKCLFEGTYEECEKFIISLNQTKEDE